MPTGISYVDETWNPVAGCSPVSRGCDRCYAERMAARLAGIEATRETYGPLVEAGRWTGRAVELPGRLMQPLRWRRGRRVLVPSMGDLFHLDISNEYRAAVWGVMAATPHHTYIVVTSRPERAERWFAWLGATPRRACAHYANALAPYVVSLQWRLTWPLPNVVLMASVEDQEPADERIPWLLRCPAAERWVSYEPALGPVDWSRIVYDDVCAIDPLRGLHGWPTPHAECERLDGVIMGGETGPGARPMDPEWVRRTRDACRAAGIRFYFKQWGSAQPGPVDGVTRLPLLGWRVHDDLPGREPGGER